VVVGGQRAKPKQRKDKTQVEGHAGSPNPRSLSSSLGQLRTRRFGLLSLRPWEEILRWGTRHGLLGLCLKVGAQGRKRVERAGDELKLKGGQLTSRSSSSILSRLLAIDTSLFLFRSIFSNSGSSAFFSLFF